MGQPFGGAPPNARRSLWRGVLSPLSRLLPSTVRGMQLLLLAPVLLPVLLVQGGIYHTWFETRRSAEIDANLELARAVAATFDAYLQDLHRQQLALGLAFTMEGSGTSAQVQRLLEQSAREYPSMHGFSWVGSDGKILASTNPDSVGLDISDRPYFRQILAGKEWTVSDLVVGRVEGQPTFLVVRGIREPPIGLRGVVLASVTTDGLGEILGVERSGRASVLLLDRAGTIVYRYPSAPGTWRERDWLRVQPPSVRTSIEPAWNGAEVTAIFAPAGGTGDQITGMAPVRSAGWVVSSSRPVNEALGPIASDLVIDATLLLLVTVAASMVALAVGRTLTLPIGRLREHALAVGSGELTRQAEASGPVEMTALAEAFNRMSKEILLRERQHEAMLRQVQESNQQLVLANIRARQLAEESDAAHRELVCAQDALQAREEAQRFLANASGRLASSLHFDKTLQRVARLAVPYLADICLLDVIEPSGLRLAALAHRERGKESLVRDFRRRHTPNDRKDHPLWRVIREGKPLIVGGVSEDTIARAAFDPEHLMAFQALELTGCVLVPLQAKGHALGVMTLLLTREGHGNRRLDLALAEELARRVAVAMDNVRLYREAQAAICDRDEFLSVAAHELKTPITSLRGFAQLTLRGLDRRGAVDPERLRQALQVIDQQSDKLSTLVARLLDVSRIDAGRLSLTPRRTNLARLLAEVVAELRGNSERHTILLDVPASLHTTVDPLRLEQVVTNLIDNAIKYSPAGGQIDVTLSSEDDGTCSISVRDRGIGIPPEQHERIFDRFYQVHTHFGGMGLGLYISREIVHLHGGTIQAESAPDRGARFVVSLPCDRGVSP